MTFIQRGHVSVNGRIVTEPSTPVSPDQDQIAFDQKIIQPKSYDYIVLNKPKGYLTTKALDGRQKTVYALIPKRLRHLSSVGRLDRDTEGLLLFTNDGDLAYKLTHPKFNVDKTYFVIVQGELELSKKKKIEKGMYLDGTRTAPAKIKNVKLKRNQTEFYITIHEGQKRQIRRMFAKIKHKVIYLKRVIQGPIVLGPIKLGKFRPLSEKEKRDLQNI